MKVINLTPHPIIFRTEDGDVVGELPASGSVARIAETVESYGLVSTGTVDVPVEMKRFGTVAGLPDPDGSQTYYVVPLLTALAAAAAGRDTSDLLFPGEQTRDERGTVNGCRTLARLA